MSMNKEEAMIEFVEWVQFNYCPDLVVGFWHDQEDDSKVYETETLLELWIKYKNKQSV